MNIAQIAVEDETEKCQLGLTGHKTIGRIVRELGQRAKANYSNKETSVDISSIISTLQNITGKKPISEGTNCNKMFNSLVSGKHNLAFISASSNNKDNGHAWVADATWEIGMIIRHWGLGEITYPDDSPVWICEEKGSIEQYIHYNWGYGGNCNGFFLCGIFDPNKAYLYDSEMGNSLTEIPTESNFRYAIFSMD